MKINLDYADNHLALENIKVGYLVRKELTKMCLNDKQRRDFRGNCKKFIIALLKKLLEKSPVTYPIVRHMRLLDPRYLVKKENKDMLETWLTRILDCLTKAHRIEEEKCDNILSQFTKFLGIVQSEFRVEFMEFDSGNESHRLDVLLRRILGEDRNFSDLWSIFRQLLILSHGQAAVERGFSVNKEASTDNLSEKAMVAKRQIVNNVRQCGGVLNVDISKELLLSASSAYRKYTMYLDSKREEEKQKKAGEKRKMMEENLTEMRVKKSRLENDIEALMNEADKLSEEGEAKHSWNCIIKCNALKERAKTKRQELVALEKGMAEEVENLAASQSKQ